MIPDAETKNQGPRSYFEFESGGADKVTQKSGSSPQALKTQIFATKLDLRSLLI